MSLMSVAFNAGEYVVAAAVLYVAYFLHENEEGRLENALIDLWLRVAAQADTARKRFARLLRESARVAPGILARVFGKRVISWQALAVSTVFALASFVLIFGPQRHGIEALRASIVATMLVGIAVAPAISRDRDFTRVLTVVSILAPLGLVVQLIVATVKPSETDSMIVKLAVLASICAAPLIDFGWLVAWRRGSAWAAGRTGILAPAAPIVAGAAFAMASAGLPLLLVSLENHASTGPVMRFIGYFVLSVAATRLFFVVVSLIQLFVLLLLLAHWLMWPPLSRIVYSAERFRLVSNRKLLGSLGAALLIHASGGAGWIVSSLKVLGVAP